MLGDIIKHYADDVPHATFKSWITEENYKELRKLGFVNFHRKLRPAIVKYIVEVVLKMQVPQPPITT